MKVSVERCIQQVRDGSDYKGYVKIANTKLDYELKFTVAIPNLDDMRPTEDLQEVRRIFQLTLKRAEANIDLTDDEFNFFISMLLPFALDFYNSPQTRDSNEGFMGMVLRGEWPMGAMGGFATIGITSNGSCDFPPELCNMLNAPKFGCALVG